MQRQLLTPNDFADLEELEQRLLDFQRYYEEIAHPFKWKFTRQDLDNLLQTARHTRTSTRQGCMRD